MNIATAMRKFIQPFISYQTPGITRISLMIYENNFKIIPFTKNATAQKNIKKRGRESILSTGRMVALIIHKIIPPII